MARPRTRIEPACRTDLSAAGDAFYWAEVERAGPTADAAQVEALVAPAVAAREVGEVLVQLVDDGRRVWLHPPAVVVTPPARPPGWRGNRLQLEVLYGLWGS